MSRPPIIRPLGVVSPRGLGRAFKTLSIAVLTLVPLVRARADFFDDARRTIKIDIPRFFEHDIPCAFGGKPTGHDKTSCKSLDHRAKRGGGVRHSSQSA